MHNIIRLSNLTGIRVNRISKKSISCISDKNLEECCKILKIPLNSRQDVVKNAFLELAKVYHPDSGSPKADKTKFVAIEDAFRVLTKHNTKNNNKEDTEQDSFDIKHTAPQHRQYLNFDGVGHGTPYQRQKQWEQARAQQAAANVLDHRINKAVAADNALMEKKSVTKKHDIKTKYGFDRLVEDLIQESMSKGEFENLNGKGKPLKEQNINPYVDFTTHKLNEVLINNGFTPEWITMNKDIDQEIETLKKELAKERKSLGPHPLTPEDNLKWANICACNKEVAQSINVKINKYNLIVPLINKQRFHVEYQKMCDELLIEGDHSEKVEKVECVTSHSTTKGSEDMLSVILDIFKDVINISRHNKKM